MQEEIDFEGNYLQQFPDWMDMVRSSVYSCGKPFKAIAADMDYSVSEFSRRLSISDTLEVPLSRFVDLMKATGDVRPVYWLIEKFIEDEETRTKRAAQQLIKLMPQINELLQRLK